ncbi:MAG: LrgB family protein [Clostridia bacterium]|nr:LrgB family protein [Clostridia bacterium]
MYEIIENSIFFGAFISIGAYVLGIQLQKRFKLAILNPLFISILAVIAILLCSGISYEVYNKSAKYLSYFLTPATVCLAIPLYEQLSLLKKNAAAIIVGILSGVITSALCVLVLACVFSLSHQMYVTLLPKSITSAIGMSISEELGGIPSITVAVIILSGIVGNMLAPFFCRIFKITDPIAKGIAVGSSSHAIGTARAIEMGEIEGAMSGLSVAVSGLVSVLSINLFALIY